VEPSHLRLMLDCVEICGVSADFMLARSDYSSLTCDTCADICQDCAKSCEEFGGDTMMEACALACRECAEKCREMVKHHRSKAA
jgi:hypothetical protein